jgi:hypothetical protein
VNAVWIVIALGVAGAVVTFMMSLRRNDGPENLGSVSTQWISEHRLGSGQDSRR